VSTSVSPSFISLPSTSTISHGPGPWWWYLLVYKHLFTEILARVSFWIIRFSGGFFSGQWTDHAIASGWFQFLSDLY
jgi:hypothetical protein